MSGELVPSQFRFTTTNNRDFVIGDPSQSSSTAPIYLVFQTTATPGYANNPYIGVVWNSGTSSWGFQMSANGSSFLNFPDTSANNNWTGINEFLNNTEIGATSANTITINGTTTVNAPITFASSTIFDATNTTFGNNVVISGDLTVNGSFTSLNSGALTIKDPNIILNDGGTTTAAAGAGLTIYGTSNATVGYAQISSDSTSWQFLTPASAGILSFATGAYNISFVPNTLSGNVSYSLPNVSGQLLVASGTYSTGNVLVSSGDHVITSSVSSTTLGYLDITSSLTGLLSGKAAIAGGNSFTGVQSINGAIALTGNETVSGTVIAGYGLGNPTTISAGTISTATGTLNVNAASGYNLILSGPTGISFSNNGGSYVGAHFDSAGNLTANSYIGPGTGLTGTAASLTVGNATTAVNSTELGGIAAASYPKLNTVNTYSASQITSQVALTAGSTVNVNAALSNSFTLTATSNFTLANPTNLVSGQTITIEIKQDSTGSRIISYGTMYKFAAGTSTVLSTAVNAIDLLTCYYDGTNLISQLVSNAGGSGGSSSNKAHSSLFRSSGISLTSPTTQTAFGFGSVANGNLHITPTSSGTIMIIVNTTAAAEYSGTSFINIMYGVGTAPNNGDISIDLGTSVISPYASCIFTGGGEYLPFGVSAITVSGLTLSTSYWFDLTAYSSAVGNIGLYSTSITLIEI